MIWEVVRHLLVGIGCCLGRRIVQSRGLVLLHLQAIVVSGQGIQRCWIFPRILGLFQLVSRLTPPEEATSYLVATDP